MLTFQQQVLCGNPLQRFSSGFEPDPEPTREFGPVANTSGASQSIVSNWFASAPSPGPSVWIQQTFAHCVYGTDIKTVPIEQPYINEEVVDTSTQCEGEEICEKVIWH